jgi:hypothetical protein
MTESDISSRHSVLFHIHPEVADISYQQAILMLTDLGHGNPDILEWEVAPSIDLRKGRIIGEHAVFRNWDVYQRFRESAKHADVVALMGTISDWWVWDRLGE